MKTHLQSILLAMALVLGFSFSASAQTTYHNVYLCGSATAKLVLPQENTLNNGDKVHWLLDGVAVGSALVYNGTANSTALQLPTTLSVGLHKYTAMVESGGCLGNASDEYEIYKLPTKTIDLATSVSTYCGENSGPTSGATITATSTPAMALPAGVEYEYSWTVTKAGSSTKAGSTDGSTTNKNIFTMSATDAGAYVFSATVKYKLSSANTGVLIAADAKGCEVGSSSVTVTVTPKPAKPSITILQ